MPKRTNDFQRLVYLVRVNLAAGAEVRESVMLRDRLTKRLREVDVVIRGQVGSQRVVVCVECRDHKRVADVTWVDAMKAKHDRLETNVLLLASSKGFTGEAEAVAGKYGIELFTLENQETADFAKLLGPDGSLWHMAYTLSVDKVSIRVGKTDDLAAESVTSMPDNLLYREDGSEFCQVKELVEKTIRSERVRDYLAREGKQEHVRFEFAWEPPVDDAGRPLFMMKLVPKVLRYVESVRILGPCKIEIGRFSLSSGRLGSVRLGWGKAKIAGHDTLAVATLAESGEAKLSINIKGPASDTRHA